MRGKWLLGAAWIVSGAAHGETPQQVMEHYADQARRENPAFSGFSASRGEQFYRAVRTHSSGSQRACANCHTVKPLEAGRHERTFKEILPFAPAANPRRFGDFARVEKWFARNCEYVLERACSAQEKGDLIAYLLSLK